MSSIFLSGCLVMIGTKIKPITIKKRNPETANCIIVAVLSDNFSFLNAMKTEISKTENRKVHAKM